jgi:hypothetical protein
MTSTSLPRRLPGVALAAVMVGLAGCGGGSDRAHPVAGALQYEDGSPVTELGGETITFTSESVGKRASGEIKPDGTFRLTTTRTDDGAFPGTYKVVLSQPVPEPERGVTAKRVVDAMYEEPDKSPLEAVVEAKSNEFTFKLKKVRPRK